MLAAAISTFAKWYSISFNFGPKATKEAMDAAMAAAGVADIKMLTPEQLAAAKAGIGRPWGNGCRKLSISKAGLWMAGAGFLPP
jgi:hypothetical protein